MAAGVLALGISGVAASTTSATAAPTFTVAGMGLQPAPVAQVAAAAAPQAAAAASAEPLPASVDLTPWAVPAGDQGQIGSCASWTVGYTLSGWYAKRQGLTGNPYAPMFLYSQLTGGRGGPTVGTSFYGNLSLEQTGGIDPLSDYAQGNYNYSLPTAAEKANATKYKIVDWSTLYYSQAQSAATGQAAIKSALAAGHPVAIGIDVYTNFFYVNATNDHYDAVSGSFAGRHAIAVLGYDAYGVRIENSWGAGWGRNGFATLSWGFLAAHNSEAYSINSFSAPSAAPAPVISALSATSGPWTGGTLTITGSNLTGGAVTFGSIPAQGITVNAAGTSITAPVPPTATIGKVNVIVTTPGGGASNAIAYTYTAAVPTITAVTPNVGPNTGGTTVTVTGTNLQQLAGAPYSVLFGTVASPKVTVAADGRSVTAVSPAGNVGPVDVKVLNPGGTSNAAPFNYRWAVAPLVTLTGPVATPAGKVTFTGTVKQPAGTPYGSLGVVLQGRPKGSTGAFANLATGVTAANGTVSIAVGLTASTELRLGVVGDVWSPVVTVTVVPAPTLSGLSTNVGPRTGGTTVTLTGANLTGATVTLGGVPATRVVVNTAGTSLTFVTPARPAGVSSLVVTTAGGSTTAINFTLRA